MWTSGYYNFWNYWNLYHSVTFDGPNRLILINYGETALDFTDDIYSRWKEWVRMEDYSKYPNALSVIGGETIGGGQFVGATYFLENGWRIKPWEGNHNFDLTGNIYTREEGETPYVNTDGNWKINITNRVSTLVFKVETAGSGSAGATINPYDIAQAVWNYSTSASLDTEAFGEHLYTKVATFAHILATK